ncbi:MAG: GNAT family N-acetyltransferase [Clostridia bacterium]|nr:GNAT family N-acetyltransferase [Clostridia bacterium]
MNYKIRELRSDEAAKLKKLACPNFSVVEQLFMSKPKIGLVAETEDGAIAGGVFLVVTGNGEEKAGCVDIMFVLPNHRGSGVAKLLYRAAVDDLHKRGCKTVMALVRGDNSQSLLRFEDAGLYPVSLRGLHQRIGTALTMRLFIKTASLACASGCYILCEGATSESIGGNANNLAQTFGLNGFMLLCGAMVGYFLHTTSNPWWNLLAALFFLLVITMGETLGKLAVGKTMIKKSWNFIMPQGGLVPSFIVALLGGFYPMLGHWYLTKRENTKEYYKCMAAPAAGAWILLMVANIICQIYRNAHPFFAATTDLGIVLQIAYMLPFYPFNTFGGKRVWENNKATYFVLEILSAITIFLVLR